MWWPWRQVLDRIFDPLCWSCQEVLPLMRETDICGTCQEKLYQPHTRLLSLPGGDLAHAALPALSVMSMGLYSDLLAKHVRLSKFSNEVASTWIIDALMDRFVREAKNIPHGAAFVPIPPHPLRARLRGNDLPYRLAQALAKGFRGRVVPVLRLNWRQHAHKSLHKDQRLANLDDRFTLRKRPPLPANTPLVLVDDIVTTGATLLSAQRTLWPHLPQGTRVTSFALAATPR